MELVVRFLKKNGAVPFRLSDGIIIFVKEGFWGIIVWKPRKNAVSPMKKELIAKYNEMSWARGVYAENWDEVQKELEQILR